MTARRRLHTPFGSRREERDATREPRLFSPLREMLVVWGIWFAVYFVTGARGLESGSTAFFAATVDEVESLWVKLAFLNVPLQLSLAVIALLFASSSAPRSRRIALGVGALLTALIAIHVVFSFAVALRG